MLEISGICLMQELLHREKKFFNLPCNTVRIMSLSMCSFKLLHITKDEILMNLLILTEQNKTKQFGFLIIL